MHSCTALSLSPMDNIWKDHGCMAAGCAAMVEIEESSDSNMAKTEMKIGNERINWPVAFLLLENLSKPFTSHS